MGKEGKFKEYFGILEREFRDKGVENNYWLPKLLYDHRPKQ